MLLHAEIFGKTLASPGITVKSISLFLQIELRVSVCCGHISARLSWMLPSLAAKKGSYDVLSSIINLSSIF